MTYRCSQSNSRPLHLVEHCPERVCAGEQPVVAPAGPADAVCCRRAEHTARPGHSRVQAPTASAMNSTSAAGYPDDVVTVTVTNQRPPIDGDVTTTRALTIKGQGALPTATVTAMPGAPTIGTALAA